MTSHRDEPGRYSTDPKELLLDYLDYYREVVAAKIDGLSAQEMTTSRLPSGWSPLELLRHLVYMERRWLRWGFGAEQVVDPHGDVDDRDRWRTGPDDTVESLLDALREGGAATRAIVEAAQLSDSAAVGGRFVSAPTPTLLWILTHVLQEYARHAGHLDITRELIDGSTGE